MLAALAATASAFVAPSVQAPRLAPAKALVEEGAFVPDMERRNIMNLILVFGGALPAVGGLAIPRTSSSSSRAAAAAAPAACPP